jgi:hypothetical protein
MEPVLFDSISLFVGMVFGSLLMIVAMMALDLYMQHKRRRSTSDRLQRILSADKGI